MDEAVGMEKLGSYVVDAINQAAGTGGEIPPGSVTQSMLDPTLFQMLMTNPPPGGSGYGLGKVEKITGNVSTYFHELSSEYAVTIFEASIQRLVLSTNEAFPNSSFLFYINGTVGDIVDEANNYLGGGFIQGNVVLVTYTNTINFFPIVTH